MNCKDCKFAIVNNDIQVGCSENKVHKFVKQGFSKISKNNYFELDRICLFKRSEDWNGNLAEETAIRLTYLFILKDTNLEELYKNIDEIKDKNPVSVYVISTVTNDSSEILNKLKELKCKYHYIVDYMEKSDWFLIDKIIKNLKTGWTLVNIVGDKFINNAKEILETSINENLERFALIVPEEDTVNAICFFNIFFKFHKGSMPQYDELSDSYIVETFENKIKTKNPDMIKNWSEI